MERDILHIYIPSFPIALARVSDPSLRGRPVAVAPRHSERAPIWSISDEARLEGLFEGMALFRARRLCPSLAVIPPDPRKVSGGSSALIRLTREYSPLWEPSTAGRLYLDLTGSSRLFGPGRDAALKLERDIDRRLNLTGSVGVAGNKLVSRIAAGYLHKPGVCDVLRGSEAQFIAPLPVAVIPGVGEARQKVLLADLNLRYVEQIAALTLPQLSLPFGPFAPLLYHRSRGIDPSPVLPPRQTPEVSSESLFSEGQNDDVVLLSELFRMAEECGLKLRSKGKATAKLVLTITHSDGLSRRKTASLKDPVNGDAAIFGHMEMLYQNAGDRRVGVKWMSLTCGKLTGTPIQAEMFPGTGDPHGADSLQGALDAVRGRYGLSAVQWGRTAARDLRSQISDLRSPEAKDRSR